MMYLCREDSNSLTNLKVLRPSCQFMVRPLVNLSVKIILLCKYDDQRNFILLCCRQIPFHLSRASSKVSLSHLQYLAEKVRESWMGKRLSLAGRFQLVPSVILSMLLHSFQFYDLLVSSFIKKLNGWILKSRLLAVIRKKLLSLPWSQVCTDKERLAWAGLGIRDLRHLNHAALLKLKLESLFTSLTRTSTSFFIHCVKVKQKIYELNSYFTLSFCLPI